MEGLIRRMAGLWIIVWFYVQAQVHGIARSAGYGTPLSAGYGTPVVRPPPRG